MNSWCIIIFIYIFFPIQKTNQIQTKRQTELDWILFNVFFPKKNNGKLCCAVCSHMDIYIFNIFVISVLFKINTEICPAIKKSVYKYFLELTILISTIEPSVHPDDPVALVQFNFFFVFKCYLFI